MFAYKAKEYFLNCKNHFIFNYFYLITHVVQAEWKVTGN